MILLPENLFINLIDIDLQQRIAEVNSMDKDAETALLLLLNGNTTDDWTLEKFEDRNILFYQGLNYTSGQRTAMKYSEDFPRP